MPHEIVTSNSAIFSFGDVHYLRSKKPYIYQTIPGVRIAARRNSIIRWEKISKLLADIDIDVKNRLVLDICCNTGVMLSMALSDGALWALGWDLPQVAEVAMQLQRSLGFSRIDMIGASLTTNYSILADIDVRFHPFLDEAVVFYLAAYAHIGLISELATMPWRILVFEGHEKVHVEGYSDAIAFLRRNATAEWLVLQSCWMATVHYAN